MKSALHRWRCTWQWYASICEKLYRKFVCL